jgi:hypothetical protein
MPAATTTPPPASQTPDGLISRLGGKVRKWKDAASTAAKERDEAKGENAKLLAQIKDLTGKADGNEAAKQRDALAQQLRDIKHQAAFKKIADPESKMTEAQVKDLWQLSGYKAEAEEPDPKAIAGIIETQKKERAYLFNAQGQQQAQAQDDGDARPAVGGGKGYSDASNQGHFIVTRAQAADPQFMQANAAKIAQASKEGRFILDNSNLVT